MSNAPPTNRMVPRPWRVVSRHQEAADVATIELEPIDGEGMRFVPGQFTMLYAFGVGEVPISISGDPADSSRLVHTIRAVGAVSRALCAAVPGTTIGVRGPFGRPWPVEQARGGDVLVVAGGLGLAPVRPIVLSALADREHFGNLNVLCGARSPLDLIFRDELRSWLDRPDLALYTSVDRATPDWSGHVGVVTMLLPKVEFEPTETTAFLCGPEVMMRVTARHLLSLGVAAENIFVSLERNMRCAVGLCGHCQFGGDLVCRDGAVFAFSDVRDRLDVQEL